jgi:hypothetical protein
LVKYNKMGIPSKQIGWSQEANLLWEIARKLERLIQVAGPTSPTTTTTTTTVAP